MVSLYIGSTSGYTGKTLVTMGLGHKFIRDGLRIGYLKPVGILPVKVDDTLTDNDAWRIYRALDLKDPLHALCPVVVTQDLEIKSYQKEMKGLMAKVVKSHEVVSRNKDLVMVGGYGSIYTGSYLGLQGLDVVRRLDAKVVLVVKYEGEYVADYVLQAKKDLRERFLGVILNKVTADLKRSAYEFTLPFLQRKNIDLLGIIPHDAIVGAVTVEELNDMLGGKVLCCHNRLTNLVEHFLIGAMQVDKAIEYFKRMRNNAVIVGGDRSDIQLSAMEAGSVCLILTGDLYPSEIILSVADQKNIPMIVVREDTYSIAKKLEKLSVRLRLRDTEKVERGMRLVAENVDFPLLYKKMGMNRRA
jgi:BioD-like phosphotransacetylase family protein